MIIDATCAPEDIRYPTDLGLLNDVRRFTEALVTVCWHSNDLKRMDGEKKPRTYRREARKEFLSVVRCRKIKENILRKGIRKQIGYCERNLRHIDALLQRMKCYTILSKQEKLYKERAGFLPARILYDKAYHSRENRAWCKKNNIELGAPSVSRPPTDENERKQISRQVRKNEIGGIEVEG